MNARWPDSSIWTWPPVGSQWVWPPGDQGIIPPPPPPPPLPASAIEYWRSDVDCETTSWKGQLLGRELSVVGSNPSAAIVAPDPGFFNGRPVAQSAEGQASWTSAGGLAATYPAGGFPYFYQIFRLRSFPTAQRGLWSTGISPANGTFGIAVDGPATARLIFGIANVVGFSVSANGTIDLLPRTTKCWLDTVDSHLVYKGVDYHGSGGGFTPPASNTASLGNFRWSSAPANYDAPVSTAFFLVCASKPTPVEEAALDGWAAGYWGVAEDRPPLPAATHSYWYGNHGLTPDSAFDQMPTGITLDGKSLLAADKPIVGLDPEGYFNGQPVGQGQHRIAYWQRSPVVTTMPTGSRPWIYAVLRVKDLSPIQQYFCGIGAIRQLAEIGVVGDPLQWVVSGVGGWTANGPLVTRGPHRIKTWSSGTVGNLTIDDVNYTGFSLATGIESAVTKIAMLNSVLEVDACAEGSIALFLICKSKPTALEENVLDAWVQAFYGLT